MAGAYPTSALVQVPACVGTPFDKLKMGSFAPTHQCKCVGPLMAATPAGQARVGLFLQHPLNALLQGDYFFGEQQLQQFLEVA